MKYILILIWFLFVEVAGAQVTLVGDQIKSSNKTKTWTPPSATDNLVGRSSTDTLTNKTINGSLNTITNVDLTAAVTGVLPVANGGTGRSSLTSNNLLIGNGTGSVSLLAPGANGTALIVSGGVWTAGTMSASGSGDVTGPASSVDSEIALFSGTGGKTLKRSSGTGFLRVSSGVMQLSSAISLASDVSGILPVNSGGTNASSFTANSVLLGNGSSAFQTVAPGSSGNILTSNGTTWTSAAPSVGTGDVTGTASSVSGEIALFGDTTGKKINRATGTGIVSIASGVLSTSSTISMAAGGTGANITASHGGLAYSTASAISIGPVGTSGQIATSSGAGAPTWISQVPLANGGTNASITASHGGLAYSTASAISIGPVGTSGYIAKSNGAAAPSWIQAVPEVNGGTNQTTYSTGNILYASGANTLSKLAIGSSDFVLNVSSGVPAWRSSVTSNSASNVRIEGARIAGASETTACTSTPCTITRSTSWLSSSTRSGSGGYTLNFSPTWGGSPYCHFTGASSDSLVFRIEAVSTSAITISVRNPTSLADAAFDVLCIGFK